MRLGAVISVLGAIAAVPVAADAGAADIVPAASERFADPGTTETPDFQRHVVPLLGRLGCNGRACHGSFQGRGGFRLSLFGYDFGMDHAALTDKAKSADGPRIDRKAPDRSLIVQKPTRQVEHEGGRRFKKNSWQHHVLRRWVESGARGIASEPRELAALEVEPKEVVFGSAPAPVQLRVVAVWKNGYREDVTCLCRFRTNDDTVVKVSAGGQLRSTGRGDTHVIAFYDNGVIAVPVMRALSDVATEEIPKKTSEKSRIDVFIEAKLRKLRVVPAAICTDAEFLRRVSIDMTGTLPASQEIEAFLADRSADKRRRKIDELLERPAYAAWWANKLCDFTGCNPNQQAELGHEISVQWYMWIFARVRENLPYDQLVRRIVLAFGRRGGQDYDEYATETSAYFREKSPADFAARETMPHYWSRRSLKDSDAKALAFAHSFLGIRLQCAQCHKHPWDQWTQGDFKQFAAFFDNVQFGVIAADEPRYRELAEQVGLRVRGKQGSPVRRDVLRKAQEGRTIPWRELYIGKRRKPVELSLLRSREVRLSASDDPRTAIMDWMNEKDHPWFARAFVNRVWAGYFSTGIVEPTDDLSPANPPSHPELLEWLTAEFVAGGYDMKWLHREIARSDAYQRSWRPNSTNREDRRNFSRAVPRRMPAEVVYDALKQATAASDQTEKVRLDLTRRAIGHLSMRLAGTYAMRVFGKPERAVNCDCERVNQPTLLQAVFLQNDPLVEQRLGESGWLEEIRKGKAAGRQLDHAALVRDAWLRTVSRPPTPEESRRALEHVSDAESAADAYRDLLWALVNTKEFILNR